MLMFCMSMMMFLYHNTHNTALCDRCIYTSDRAAIKFKNLLFAHFRHRLSERENGEVRSLLICFLNLVNVIYMWKISAHLYEKGWSDLKETFGKFVKKKLYFIKGISTQPVFDISRCFNYMFADYSYIQILG